MPIKRSSFADTIGFLLVLPFSFAIDLSTFPLQLGMLLTTGADDLTVYPDRRQSPYKLPWPAGQVHFCVQGNDGIVSHKKQGKWSYDFAMPLGSEVAAARAGRIVAVVDGHSGKGSSASNNKVGILHEDKTVGWYLHIKKSGSLVKVGQQVRQGQVIALSGDVGISLLPHLHFHVRGSTSPWSKTMPVAFQDLDRDEGIPRMFRFYRSGNR